MLSQIQQVQVLKVSDLMTIELKECEELQILNALATILIINNEVIAVVVKHDVPNKLEVIACTYLPNNRNQPISMCLAYSNSPSKDLVKLFS